MKVLIVYDSSHGNTEAIAKSICSGMKEVGNHQVTAKKGNTVTPEEMREAEVWILGSPTHMGGPTRKFKKLLKWVGKEVAPASKGMAFDTRMPSEGKGASSRIHQVMKGAGVEMLGDPEGFQVEGRKGPLAQGEERRAVTLGRKLAALIRS
ncbi:MAG: flavodoxin family protein [Methanomassiliicoccales archaeon]